MIKNYLKIALRNLKKSKLFSVLNIIGLSIGISASLMITLYARYELSYDSFHEDGEQIYRVRYDNLREGEHIFKSATTFPAVGPTMKADFSQVEEQARLFLYYGGSTVTVGDDLYNEGFIFQADQSFIDMFDYPWVEGNQTEALVNTNTAVISEAIAKKYFSNAETAIGQRIKIGVSEEYEVAGVMESPENSHIKFDILLSYPTGKTVFNEAFEDSWGWYDFYTYVRLKEGSNPKDLESGFEEFVVKYKGEEARGRTVLSLQPMTDIYLYSSLIQEARVNGSGKTVNILLTIAIAILIIAWINYINLATAKALQRAKEVGVRKVVGAHKRQLVAQFLFESWTLNILSALFALLIIDLALPVFNEVAGKSLSINYLTDLQFWLYFGSILLLGGILSGLYPAFVLSNYKPAIVLKGKFQHSFKGVWLRKALVIFQFGASAMLILGTVVVYTQINFMRNQDLGIDINQTLVVSGPQIVENDTVYRESWSAFKNEVKRLSAVKEITTSSEVPGNLIYWTNGARKPEDDPNATAIMYKLAVDENYIPTYSHELIAGRNFSNEINEEENVILSNKAVEVFSLGTPEESIGRDIKIGGDTLKVVGVVADYHQQGLKNERYQVAFLHRPFTRRYYSLKVDTENIEATIEDVRSLFASMYPGNTFDYFFLDQHYDEQYRSEVQFGKVFTIFSILAIFVACLGLFGLSLFTAYQRTKEIGIRKIMGASTWGIFKQLSKQFILLVIVSNAIAWPIAWYFMNSWLSSFTFHIDMGPWMYLLSGIITLIIALVTISYQSLSAAVQNPVKSLRSE